MARYVQPKYDAEEFADAGQIVSLSCGDGTPFKAAAEVYPSMIDPADAPDIKVPIAILASGDKDASDVKNFIDALKVPHYSETFGSCETISKREDNFD